MSRGAKQERPRLVYLGGVPGGHPAGSHITGVPARDLSDADIAHLSAKLIAQATAAHPTLGPLYAEARPEGPISAADSGDEPDELTATAEHEEE